MVMQAFESDSTNSRRLHSVNFDNFLWTFSKKNILAQPERVKKLMLEYLVNHPLMTYGELKKLSDGRQNEICRALGFQSRLATSVFADMMAGRINLTNAYALACNIPTGNQWRYRQEAQTIDPDLFVAKMNRIAKKDDKVHQVQKILEEPGQIYYTALAYRLGVDGVVLKTILKEAGFDVLCACVWERMQREELCIQNANMLIPLTSVARHDLLTAATALLPTEFAAKIMVYLGPEEVVEVSSEEWKRLTTPEPTIIRPGWDNVTESDGRISYIRGDVRICQDADETWSVEHPDLKLNNYGSVEYLMELVETYLKET
jgi:hypothetical protein